MADTLTGSPARAQAHHAGWFRGERTLRLATGLTLFSWVATHLINHAFGAFGIDAMYSAAKVLLPPWQTPVGRTALYGAALIHMSLGLWSLWRRRNLRIPAAEWWQLVLGLSIPLLLLQHVVALRSGNVLFGLHTSYTAVLYDTFVAAAPLMIVLKLALLWIAWIHGSIGIWFWLRHRRWFAKWVPALAAIALLIPALATVGIVAGGLTAEAEAANNAFVRARLTTKSGEAALVEQFGFAASLSYALILASVLVARVIRHRHSLAQGGVTVHYPTRGNVRVPAGFSVLEASRWGGITHASVCGGRGRCSTCRVRVLDGASKLPAPITIEAETLARIKAPDDVRLACQLRPTDTVSVAPLYRSGDETSGAKIDTGGREIFSTAFSVDLRGSTKLVAARLPYDAFVIVDRFVDAVSGAVRDNGGEVCTIAGDGVMAMFGLTIAGAEPDGGARAALAAALATFERVDALNAALADELSAPLAFGVGLHSGMSIVGRMGSATQRSFQYLGDTGNTAARLEALTKGRGLPIALSASTVKAARLRGDAVSTPELCQVEGLSEPVTVFFADRDVLTNLVASTSHIRKA